MSFLKDFVGGFAAVKAAQYESEQKRKDELDLYRQKKLEDLDISKKEADYKAQKEAERFKELRKAIEGDTETRTAEQVGEIFTPGSAQPTPPNPFNMTPTSPVGDTNADFNEAQSWREKQAKAQALGAEDFAKEYKTRADIADERIKLKDKNIEKKQKGYKTREGMNVASEIYKEDTGKLGKNESDTSLYYKYFGIKRDLSPNNEEDSEAIKQALASSAEAVKLSNILTEVTSDESQISDKSVAELKLDSENLVSLKNQYSVEQDPEKKQLLLSSISDIIGEYPTADTLILRELGMDKLMVAEEQVAKPVELSTDSTSINTQEEYDALPSGATYIDAADGKKYRKP